MSAFNRSLYRVYNPVLHSPQLSSHLLRTSPHKATRSLHPLRLSNFSTTALKRSKSQLKNPRANRKTPRKLKSLSEWFVDFRRDEKTEEVKLLTTSNIIAAIIDLFLSDLTWALSMQYRASDENRRKARRLLLFPFAEKWFESGKRDELESKPEELLEKNEPV
jgi:hypothetical protein